MTTIKTPVLPQPEALPVKIRLVAGVVRIKHKLTGHEYNVAASLAEVDPLVEVIDKPTHTEHGAELGPKYAIRAPRNRGAQAIPADNNEAEEAGA